MKLRVSEQSVDWSNVGIYWMSRVPLRTCSRAKLTFISMCFMCVWKTRMTTELGLTWDPTHLVAVEFKLTQRKHEPAPDTQIHSNSLLDGTTTIYFLKDHKTRLLPMNTQYTTIEFRSSTLNVQSASMKALMLRSDPCWNKIYHSSCCHWHYEALL